MPRITGTASLATVLTIAASLTAGAAGTAGCGRAGDAGTGPRGTVHGWIRASGGPRTDAVVTLPGRVTVRRGGRAVATRQVSERTGFRFSLAPGRYRLEARSGDALCLPVDVTVTAGADLAADVTCSIK